MSGFFKRKMGDLSKIYTRIGEVKIGNVGTVLDDIWLFIHNIRIVKSLSNFIFLMYWKTHAIGYIFNGHYFCDVTLEIPSLVVSVRNKGEKNYRRDN